MRLSSPGRWAGITRCTSESFEHNGPEGEARRIWKREKGLRGRTGHVGCGGNRKEEKNRKGGTRRARELVVKRPLSVNIGYAGIRKRIK